EKKYGNLGRTTAERGELAQPVTFAQLWPNRAKILDDFFKTPSGETLAVRGPVAAQPFALPVQEAALPTGKLMPPDPEAELRTTPATEQTVAVRTLAYDELFQMIEGGKKVRFRVTEAASRGNRYSVNADVVVSENPDYKVGKGMSFSGGVK